MQIYLQCLQVIGSYGKLPSIMKKIGILIERERAFSRDLCSGIIKYAQECNEWTLTMLDFESLINKSDAAEFDGFIVRALSKKIADTFAATGKPVVDLFEERDPSPFVRVMQNPMKIAQMAARHFLQHRFTNFAFFGHEGAAYSDMRRNAFTDCIRLHRKNCFTYTPPPNIQNFEKDVLWREKYNVGAEKESIANFVRKLPKPIAIFCSNDLRAHQLITVCREIGVDIPNEIAVLGVDNDEILCTFSSPSISSIDPNAREIGYKAAMTLAEIMCGKGVEPVTKIKPKELITRASTQIYPIDPHWISDALVFIHTNVHKNLSAHQVYKHVKRSHTIVDSAFRKTLGTTVQKEIATSRLREAHRLLLSTDLPLATIAKLSGFASIQYLTRMFTSAYGKSPIRMRNQGSSKRK